jgi:hypothetical protein
MSDLYRFTSPHTEARFPRDAEEIADLYFSNARIETVGQVKFFEHGFDWASMAYVFHPHYWADKCGWPDLLQTVSGGDAVFEGFLQCGSARVLVLVTPGFEEAVCYYLRIGKLWLAGDLVFESADDLDISILEEMESLDGFVEEEWQSRVPTTLTIVQGTSAYLDAESLPCCDSVEIGDISSGFQSSSALLGGGSRASSRPPR